MTSELKPSHARVPLLAYALLFAIFLFWTAYGQWSQYNLDQFADMVENHAWGIRWQLGNVNHPPLFGWITAAWFKIFPRTDLAYRFLAAANIAVSFLVMLHIAKRFLNSRQIVVALAVALALPLLGFMSLTYNANSAMLPFWALSFLAYLRILEKGRIADALQLGLWTALAMLSKYLSAVLLLAILVHSLADPSARRLWRSALPVAAAAVFAIVLMPHLVWLYRNDFTSFEFAVAKQGARTASNILGSQVEFFFAQVLYALPGFGVAALHRRWRDGQPLFAMHQFMALTETARGRALLSVGLLPIPLTMLLGLIVWAPLTSNWSVPFFIFAPILIVLQLPAPLVDRHPRTAPVFIIGFIACLLALSPFIRGIVLSQGRANSDLPVADIIHEADDVWFDITGAPLMYTNGDRILAFGATFYSRFTPMAFNENALVRADWITRDDIAEHGYMILCLSESCADRPDFESRGEIKRVLTVPPPKGASRKSDYTVTVFIRPPEG